MKKLLCILGLSLAFISCERSGDLGGETSVDGSGQGGSLARFAVAGDHLYAVDGTELKVFDISNRDNAIYLSRHQLNVAVETIFPRDNATLFIGSVSGMYIYDISSAPNLSRRSVYQHITACDPVVANQDYAYVTLRSEENSNFCRRSVNQLDIIDISDLDQPQLVNTFPLVNPYGLGLYGDTLFVCDRGLKIFNVKDPQSLKLLTADEDFPARDLIPYGNLIIAVSDEGINQYRYHQGKLNLLSSL